MPHRLEPWLAACGPGQKLFSETAGTFIKKLRAMLAMVGVEQSQAYTLKTFRAGKATALMVAGAKLGEVLKAGEWRSHAILNYVDEGAVDEATFLEETMAVSDDE